MFDFHNISNWVLGAFTLWCGYLHNSLKERPTRDELLLRFDNIELKIDQTKDDIAELKDQLYDNPRG